MVKTMQLRENKYVKKENGFLMYNVDFKQKGFMKIVKLIHILAA